MSLALAAFAALGDPVRSTIVDRLVQADATVGELAAGFDLSFQAVSQHLGVLERAGLVSRHREGRHRRVRLEPAGLGVAADWMESRRRRLEERYRRLDAVLRQLQEPSDPARPDDPAPSEQKETR